MPARPPTRPSRSDSHRHRRARRAGAVYLLFQGSWALLNAVAFTLLLLYQVRSAHLDPFQLVVVGTVMEATCFLGEIPTGVIADLYSRRLSVVVGAGVVGLGLLVQGGFPSFWPIVVGNVVWALGYTCVSGAIDAWVADEVGAAHVQALFTRAEQQRLALGIVGALVAGLLGTVDLQLPLLAAGAGFVVLSVVLVIVMPETGFEPTTSDDRETFAHMRTLLAQGLGAARRPGVVRSFLLVALLTGLSSEVFDRLWTARVLALGTGPRIVGGWGQAWWFTILALVGNAVALVANLLANRYAAGRLTVARPARLLAGLSLVQVAGITGFALSGGLWPALGAMWLRDAARSVAGPVQYAWLNRDVESGARATTLSLASQADAVGQVVGGPSLGALATRTSIPVALVASAVVLAPSALVYGRLRSSVGRAGTPD
jgi:DHA3 family tetracycline resistance protein-like MFS transporter